MNRTGPKPSPRATVPSSVVVRGQAVARGVPVPSSVKTEVEKSRGDGKWALLVAALYLGWLLSSARSLGYARDEGFYFYSARAYRGWFELLFSEPARAFERANVDRFWVVNHEHPSLMKVLFMFSHWLFHDKLGWIRESGTAYRLPGMLMASLAVALLFLWGSRSLGRSAGVVSALCFALMPRVFYHSHLACFDVPVSAMWLLTAYSYFRSLETPSFRWLLASGMAYGLLLETKHNAWLFPAVLVLHVSWLHWLNWHQTPAALPAKKGLSRWLPPALIWMAVLGPLLFWALWPWLWFEPMTRFVDYVRFHTQHEYYNMEFLGRTYFRPPMPPAYAWLMTLATVPTVTLLQSLVGVLIALGILRRATPPAEAVKVPGASALKPEMLWLFAVLVSYAPWWSDKTPIFGGTKHWLPAYPFLCLLAGLGFQRLQLEISALLATRARLRRVVTPALILSTLAGPLVMTLHSHPFGLSFYMPLVGGTAGAATLGLNRTFWGYTTGSLVRYLNEHARANAVVYLHDTAVQSWDMLRTDGRLRSDLSPTLSIEQSDIALYHHEPHMGRVEYQIWVAYETVVPDSIATLDGVPVVWLYQRP